MALTDQFSNATARCAPRAGSLNLRTFIALWRSRRALARLDTRALADIGVTRDAADLEAQRPIWDVPHSWRHH